MSVKNIVKIVVAALGGVLAIIAGFLLGGMVHKRPGKGRVGQVDDVHGGAISQANDTAQQLEGQLDDSQGLLGEITDGVEGSAILADSIADTNQDSLSGIRRIKDILAKARHRNSANSGG